MLIENTEARIIHLPQGGRLLPGVNDIEASAWKASLAHPVIAALVSMGSIKPSLPNATSSAVLAPVVDTLGAFSASESDALISKTYDRELLQKWLSVEKRSKIKKAIDAQLALLSPAPSAD